MEFTNRKYGVEIEFLSSVTKEAARIAIENEGITCYVQGYNHTDVEGYWKIVTDGSCGNEVVSPILSGEDGLVQIEKVCKALTLAGAKVNKTCGLHVHVDARDLSKKQVAKVFIGYARYEKLFDALMPESRRRSNNNYCGSISRAVAEADRYMNNLDGMYRRQFSTRYLKVNLESLVRHGSIEFRQHSGTVDAEKITNWVVFMVGFVEEVIKYRCSTKAGVMTLGYFKTLFGIKANSTDARISKLASYLNKRLMEMSNLKVSSEIA